MIRVCARDRHPASPLVVAALQRSVGMDQVVASGFAELDDRDEVVVAIDPGDEADEVLARWCAKPARKLLVLGALSRDLSRRAGARAGRALDPSAALSPPAERAQAAESPARVQYSGLALGLSGRVWLRPFARFDFTDEWNNHGYGAIRADRSIWSIAEWTRLPEAVELASIAVAGGAPVASYAGLFVAGGAAVLWFNRPVGPIDSFEWCLVEDFLASFMAASHVCQPVLNEMPFGFDAAVTMRLDCDEDVASARPLWQSYDAWRVPFSLAIHTALLPDARHAAFIREVAAAGGSILSHSATHAADWGGNYDHAVTEAAHSAAALTESCGVRPLNAVSPFHETPDYAIRALADCGYLGCVGGTVRQYPETVIARGGAIAGHPATFAFHTQQCMLHGDCLTQGGDAMAGYRTAFDLAYESRSIFGYLDHPFSSRYAYGWTSESARRAAHEALLTHIRATAAKPVFLSEDDALAFLRLKAGVRIDREAGAFRLRPREGPAGPFACGVTYRGSVRRLPPAGLELATHL